MFALPTYTTVGGRTLKNVKVGYETYGKLNAAGDNAIFIPHFFSGTSHAAGKYAPADVAPGYWDSIVGSGRPIDTDKYFVVSADALANLNTKDPNVTTTGPASIDPDTGKPYALSFPVVTYRDTVRVHRALLDSLGVKKLHAVVGASGGSIQAMEWAAAWPDFVPRVVHVIGPGFDIFAVRDRDARCVDDADPARSEVERRRLLRARRTARRRRECAQDHHHHDARAGLGREDVRLQAGGRGEGARRRAGQRLRDRGHARQGRARAREDDRRELDALHVEGEPALPADRRRGQAG